MVDEINEKNVVIENKNRENEELLLNVLPGPIANRLRGGEQGIADGFAEVTVAFAPTGPCSPEPMSTSAVGAAASLPQPTRNKPICLKTLYQ